MTSQDLLQRCKEVVGDSQGESWNAENLGPFFQHFRPNGRGLELVFEGVPHGDQILSRLKMVYTVAGETLQDAYFIVRSPRFASTSDARSWAKDHFENMSKLAREAGSEELAQMLGRPPAMSVVRGLAPPRPTSPAQASNLECLLLDRIGDLILGLQPKSGLALTLREAFYYIACDFHLCDYLLWPVYEECVNVSDPFAPYFNLWKHGIEIRYPSNTEIVIYAPPA
jgi:hypothetical protein